MTDEELANAIRDQFGELLEMVKQANTRDMRVVWKRNVGCVNPADYVSEDTRDLRWIEVAALDPPPGYTIKVTRRVEF